MGNICGAIVVSDSGATVEARWCGYYRSSSCINKRSSRVSKCSLEKKRPHDEYQAALSQG